MDAVKTIGLTKKYKDITAVDGIDLTVRKGELFSLLGVNGAGKTTTVKMLCCLTEPTAGEAYVGGFSVKSQSSEVRKIIGVSPQETAVAPKLTVKENLGLMCGVHGFSKEESLRAIEELVEKFRLGEILGKSAGKLSGGWQRRLSIAMALIGKPEILFLDEPTLGLDGNCASRALGSYMRNERLCNGNSYYSLYGGSRKSFRQSSDYERRENSRVRYARRNQNRDRSGEIRAGVYFRNKGG